MCESYLSTVSFKWSSDLVKSRSRLFINSLLFIALGIAGLTYTTYAVPIIILFGALIPSILTWCLYKMLMEVLKKADDFMDMPQISSKRMALFCVLDIFIQLLLVALVVSDILTSSVFWLIACPIIPVIELLCLRFLYVLYVA